MNQHGSSHRVKNTDQEGPKLVSGYPVYTEANPIMGLLWYTRRQRSKG